jgi:uncharacterized protein
MRKLPWFIVFILSCSIMSIGQTTGNNNKQLIDSLDKVSAKLRDYVIRMRPIGYVNDFESVFTKNENLSLDTLVSNIEKESTVEIAVVSIDTALIHVWDSTYHKKLSFDTLTLLIAKRWAIGKKNKDNGILIGFSKELHLLRIQNGYGIEKKISNIETKEIIDDFILPQFKKGNYYEGVKAGILAIYKKLYPMGTIH